jgi:2-aminoethylphosphonate-pyruvate transaminase
MIKVAAILAAGWGSRLGELTEHTPKGLLEVGGKPLLQRSVEQLKAAGVEQIVIGTGYCAHVIEEFFADYAGVACVRLNRYRDVQSMYTLRGLQEKLTEDFLLLEGDLLYEPRALTEAIHSSSADAILAAEDRNTHDAVLLEVDAAGNLINMSKHRSDLDMVAGELVGITKLSQPTYREMCTFAERHLSFHADMYYEEALIEAAAHKPLPVRVVSDLAWCEIDNHDHLEHAMVEVWPAIQAKTSVPVR